MKSVRMDACRRSTGRCTPRRIWSSAGLWRPSSIRRKARPPSALGFISGSLSQVWEGCRSGRRLPWSLKARTPMPVSQSWCSTSSRLRSQCASRSCCHLMRAHARLLSCPWRSGVLCPTGSSQPRITRQILVERLKPHIYSSRYRSCCG